MACSRRHVRRIDGDLKTPMIGYCAARGPHRWNCVHFARDSIEATPTDSLTRDVAQDTDS